MREIDFERATLAELIARDKPGTKGGRGKPSTPGMGFVEAMQIVDKLGKAAATLQRYHEHDCNYGLTEDQEKRYGRLRERTAKLVADSLGRGFKLRVQTDPRGCPLYLILPCGRGNGWGGPDDGWAVPYQVRRYREV